MPLGPESAHSPNAEDLNTLYWVMLAIGGVLVVAINAGLIWLAVRYRRSRGREARGRRGRSPRQLAAAGALCALAAVVFALGVIFTESASDVEASGPDGLQAASQTTAQRNLTLPTGDEAPLVIKASGQQWIWRYQYPDGTFSYYELVVPVDTAVLIELDSTDVVHRWWVPGLGAKIDAVPGTSNQTWFKADQEGTYPGASYQFSGASYAVMRTEVTVLGVTEYKAWLQQQGDEIKAAQQYVQEKLTQGSPLDLVSEGLSP